MEETKECRKRISKSLLTAIKMEYIEGKKSIKEVCSKYNVNPKTVSQTAWREAWRVKEEEIVPKIVERIEKRESLRLELLRKHEEEMLSRMRKRLDTVDLTFEQIGNLVEPGDLSSLVKTESTIDQVVRRNLGCDEVQRVDVTSGGQSILDVLNQVRKLNADASRAVVDIPVEVMQEMAKNLVEG